MKKVSHVLEQKYSYLDVMWKRSIPRCQGIWIRLCTLLSFCSLGVFTIYYFACRWNTMILPFTLLYSLYELAFRIILAFSLWSLWKLKENYAVIRFRSCPHVSVFLWKRNFFFTDTASVHTYPTKTKTETETLRTRYQFQSTPRNTRNLFKMADARFPFLSFILGLISDLTACFQANLALLILQADYSRRRQNYQVTFATGVKRQKVGSPFRLTLFLPWFWHFKLFLWLWRTSQQYKPTPKKVKDGANLLFRGLIIANKYASSIRSRVSYRFQIDSSYRCGRAKTTWKCYEWTRYFLENGEKKLRFQTNTDTCDRALGKTWKIEAWNRTKKQNRLPYKVYQPRSIYNRIV